MAIRWALLLVIMTMTVWWISSSRTQEPQRRRLWPEAICETIRFIIQNGSCSTTMVISNLRTRRSRTKVADYEFSWGCIFEDFNLDGRTDLVVSENYVDLPPHKLKFLRLPCRFMVQNANEEYAAVGAEAGVVNQEFGLSPVTADFNQDGAPDLVHVNLAGHSKVYLSNNPQSGFVKVKLPNVVESVSALVKAELADGRTIYEPFVKGEGLCSDSSPMVTVGTGGSEVKSVEVTYLNGKSQTFDAPELGSTLVGELPTGN